MTSTSPCVALVPGAFSRSVSILAHHRPAYNRLVNLKTGGDDGKAGDGTVESLNLEFFGVAVGAMQLPRLFNYFHCRRHDEELVSGSLGLPARGGVLLSVGGFV